ncbi:centrosomal protein 15 [Brachionichthys hirsutus]|uniref:centrosomal protein 15 n=1 Tax=Brachionichthys hirsutus TaxID=412623 RepID=UPI003604D457
MSVPVSEEIELIEKHEEILQHRAELLERMEARREQLIVQKRRQVEESEAARHRNASLLQNLQKIENRLGQQHLQNPALLALEARYWASVEQSIPAWEKFLLFKGPHPTDGPEEPARRTKHTDRKAKDQGLPPWPKARASP